MANLIGKSLNVGEGLSVFLAKTVETTSKRQAVKMSMVAPVFG
jgi:hypothetical protein